MVSIVCKHSIEWGFEGFITFRAKSKLVGHYQKTLGAKVIFGDTMALDDFAANRLVKKYIVGGVAGVERR